MTESQKLTYKMLIWMLQLDQYFKREQQLCPNRIAVEECTVRIEGRLILQTKLPHPDITEKTAMN